jgi:hypothetical protein
LLAQAQTTAKAGRALPGHDGDSQDHLIAVMIDPEAKRSPHPWLESLLARPTRPTPQREASQMTARW